MALLDPYVVGQGFPDYTLTGLPNGVCSMGFPYGGATYVLTTAQLLALQTTAVVLVPGAVYGKNILIPNAITLKYKFNTTAFTVGNADNYFRVSYHGKTTNLYPITGAGSLLATGLVDQTASTILTVQPANVGAIAEANCQNLSLDIQLEGTTPALTLGDGALHVCLRYTIVIAV
jgi:hypothetical protein